MKLKLYFILHRNAKRTGATKTTTKAVVEGIFATISTNKGDITVQFDTKKRP
jgi:hypothetical protein